MLATITLAPRTLRWTPNGDDFSPTTGALEVTVKGKVTCYVVREFPTGLTGRAFQLTKVGGDGSGYAVICSHRGAKYDECECPAHAFRGKCRHRDAVRKLLDLGKL